jgi:hypothetical protein
MGEGEPVNRGIRALELIDLMKGSEGQQVENEIEMLGWSTHTLQRNIRQLTSYVTRATEDRTLTWLRNRDKLEFAQKEIARYLHNAVAAVTSLVDHSRVVSGRLFKTHPDHMLEYQRRIKTDFKEDPLIQFVQGLREYCLHYGLPFVGWSFGEKDGELHQAFFINKALLLKGFKWKSIAKRHLVTLDDQIDFVGLIEEYEDAIGHFYRWFEADVRSLYSAELEELVEYQREYHLIHLEDNLDSWGTSYGTRPELSLDVRLENLFANMLASTTLDRLQTIDDPQEKVESLLARLEPNLRIPNSLKERIRGLIDDNETNG